MNTAPRPIYRLICALALVLELCSWPSTVNADEKETVPAASRVERLDEALDVNELKIEMAETSLKINPTLRTIADLSFALENYLTATCFGNLFRTLKYDGPPTDPRCIARMERLLSIYPHNPIAICLRDGIESPTCVEAYRSQEFESFSGGSSLEDVPDPALKVGLTRQDTKKLDALFEMLRNVNDQYQAATKDAEKQKLLDDATQLHEKILSTSCAIAAIRLKDSSDQVEEKEDPSIREIRERLLKVPPGLRGDYQKQLLQKTEEELARSKGDPGARALILAKIKVIQDPEKKRDISASGKIRVRVVLPKCAEAIDNSSKAIPRFAAPTCYQMGWYSPQCVAAIRNWYAYRQQVEAEVRKRNPKAPTPTPRPLISKF